MLVFIAIGIIAITAMCILRIHEEGKRLKRFEDEIEIWDQDDYGKLIKRLNK